MSATYYDLPECTLRVGDSELAIVNHNDESDHCICQCVAKWSTESGISPALLVFCFLCCPVGQSGNSHIPECSNCPNKPDIEVCMSAITCLRTKYEMNGTCI